MTVHSITPYQRQLHEAHKARVAKWKAPPAPRRIPIIDHPEADGPIRVRTTLATVMREVARRHGFPPHIIRSNHRKKGVNAARNEFCYLAKMRTQSTLTVLARMLRRKPKDVVVAIDAYRKKRRGK